MTMYNKRASQYRQVKQGNFVFLLLMGGCAKNAFLVIVGFGMPQPSIFSWEYP